MRLRRASWCLLLAACTPIDPPVRHDERVEPPRPAAPTAEDPAAQSEPVLDAAPIDQTLPWRWISRRPPGEPEHWSEMPTHVDNGPTRVEARASASGGVVVEQTRDGAIEWTTVVGGSHAEAAALGWAGDVVVAHYHPIASGTTLTRLERSTGAPVWEVPLEGLGPVSHSKYRNTVQLEVAAGRIVVYGWESQGAYVEIRSLEDGALLEHSLVEPALVELAWAGFEDDRAGRDGFSLAPPWSVRDEHPPQVRFSPPGSREVAVALPHDFGGCNVGAGVEHEGVLYLAHVCSITSGARAYALSEQDWSWRWQTDLVGVGPIAHSAYSNRVRIEWVDGRILVHGDEAMGRYVEAIDPDDGRTLATKRWPPTGS